MYAVIKTGGKQYRISEGDIIEVELLSSDENQGVLFKEVLLLHDGSQLQVGNPCIPGASVAGTLLDYVKGDKVVAFKYKKRKNYARKVGHRQKYARLKVTSINKG